MRAHKNFSLLLMPSPEGGWCERKKREKEEEVIRGRDTAE